MTYENISVRVDKETKRKFNSFCDSVGLNPSSAINLYIKKVVNDYKIPFEIAYDSSVPNAETVAAMEEADCISRDPSVKKYKDFSEFLAEVQNAV
ncbi:MAG: type II toxin-antitoxin system RelB/DinJ family antitoxin [Holosporales bacterium]|jgi:DNA-damage-inducible protein J|nr:type II toxin-antitoxin system RelB/DinJ family antitoxin [Holosporales bacterium]